MAKRHLDDEARKDKSLPSDSDGGTPAQPDSNEQSGSTGRRTDGGSDTGKDSGQGRYGQSGFGGRGGTETEGQSRYQNSGPDGGQQPDPSGTRVGNRTVHPTKVEPVKPKDPEKG